MTTEGSALTTAATHVAAFLLSDHQVGEAEHCTCGDHLRSDLSSSDGMAAHQVAILEDAGLLAE